MNKIIPICIVGILLSTAFGAVAQVSNGKNQGNNLATHTVFGEDGTATWCGYCKYAHGALKALYKGGWHDFYYTTLVDDKNTHASARRVQLGITGFPTVCWDGKYRTNVGAGSIPSAMAAYNTSIIACAARTVPNIDVLISTSWLGSGTVSITVTVRNNDATTYNGYLRCYVTEITSSMGWIDTAGYPYTFPFLDYAFDQSISAPGGGGVWSNTVTWDGSLHNDGYGHTFAGITQDNTFIIAAVFASSGGYVDETAGHRVGSNRPPNTPNTPNPTNGATNVGLTPTLTWKGDDPDWFDDVYYDVYFAKNNPAPPLVVSNQTDTTYTPGTLDMNTTYYWRIIAHDEYGATSNGPIWQFTTRGNAPPNIPSNPNPSNGSTNVPLNKALSWTGGDPNGDPVKYDVYFGTTSPPPKVSSNQSGTTYNPGTLTKNTTYFWKIVAWDSFVAKSVGPIWKFTTTSQTNLPPSNPVVSGPSQGKAGTETSYNFTSTDPNSDQILYYVEWGDGTNSGWLGPYASGYKLTKSHTWTTKGSYTIKAKARDVYGAESDWGTLQISMPLSLGVPTTFLHWLLERFPHAFPLLRLLLG